MTRRKQLIAVIVGAISLAVLGLAIRASTREPFVGDPYEHQLGYYQPETERPAAQSPVMDWEISQECFENGTEAGQPQEAPSEDAAEQEPEPNPCPLPETEAKPYADTSTPSMPAGSGVVMGTPVVRGTKSLIPLYPAPGNTCVQVRFLTLAEAVEQKHARIVDSGSVSSVYLVNDSDRPIFLMCGEIIFGGKQDRVIAQDTVIPAQRDVKFRVSVFCVESSRWQTRDSGYAFTCKPEIYKEGEYAGPDDGPDPGSKLPSLAQVKEKRKWEEFFNNLAGRGVAHACIASKCGEGGQGEVWSRVSETNRRLETENSTNTYRNNLLSPKVHQRIEEDLDAFFAATRHDGRAIGYAFSLDGTVLYSDIFANPDLCGKYRYRLIKAYLLETLGEGCNPRFTPDAARLEDFLKWVDSKRLSEKSRPGFAFYKSDYLIGCDCTYQGKRLHSGYYYDGFSGR